MLECMEHTGELHRPNAIQFFCGGGLTQWRCRCSHCYDQKEAFGKAAFSKIPYIECSKDGYNEQNAFCKESGTFSLPTAAIIPTRKNRLLTAHDHSWRKGVPGYPTWSIKGKLYPGEQSLEELEEIVQEAKK